MRKKTYMPADAHYRAKWQMALDLLDQARSDGAPHRAVVADSWYGDITDFRQGLDDRQERYIVGIYSDTQVFLESPVFVQPDHHKKKRGRKRKSPLLIETNPLPVKVSDLGKCVADGDWEHLEIRRDCLDNPLVIEAVSRRVFPAQGYRKGAVHEEVWLIIERRRKDGSKSRLHPVSQGHGVRISPARDQNLDPGGHSHKEATMAKVSGGQLVAKALRREGIETIFTLCGGHVMDIYNGCLEEGIRIIDVRHEQTAAHAADAWTRLTGFPGVASSPPDPA